PIASAIRRINELPAPVVAVDVPSGLGTGCCVRAALTVTFGLPKIELLRYPDEVGRIEVVDIGLTGSVESDVELIAAADVRPLF
ncbi:MAG: bifunctional ADP-dependent NAD(P)H-hydrate dehydratase/NAD(P)H-hydrate epimerase, partial [Verrucomicrobiae bacterium]|nr:bifunctional ADP-dependent NAD(P)H-hydrate dehydratase/NAD(P)H-hydrate epimerase [Verrucomicrobiae bacterium]